MTTTFIIGLLIPLLGTMLGSAFVFFMWDEMSVRLQKSLLGFASGVMVAASVWSLLIPAMEMEVNSGKWAVFPAAVGFLLGMGFLLLIDELTPHLHIGTDKPEGLRSHLSKTAMLALAVTIHNLPEGMAVGVVFAGADNGATHISSCPFSLTCSPLQQAPCSTSWSRSSSLKPLMVSTQTSAPSALPLALS